MAAVGAAVNEMREAQSLMMPIMLVADGAVGAGAPIAREPNSTFSTVISFIPPVNTFAMLLRLTSSAPPPSWQVWLTIVIGVASVVGSRLVRREGVPDRPADVRQAARPEDADSLDPRGVISTPTTTSSRLRAACAG